MGISLVGPHVGTPIIAATKKEGERVLRTRSLPYTDQDVVATAPLVL